MALTDEEFEKELQQEFLAEAEELLEEFEGLLLKVESGNYGTETTDSLFRIAHTIKGSAYSVGFDKLAHFVHKVENLLSEVREGRLEFSQDMADTMLESQDVINKMVESLQSGSNPIATEAIEARLLTFLGDDYQESASKAGVATGPGFGFFDDEVSEGPAPNSKPANHASESEDDLAARIKKKNDYLTTKRTETILVCDDEPDIRNIMQDILEEGEFKVLTAENGRAALEKMKQSNVDLVISDLVMPEMDGVTFLEHIREHDKKMPIIMISGFAEKSDLIKLINQGIDGFIEKPFEIEDVLMKVETCLRLKRIRDAVVSLSTLNYQAYMATIKILNKIKAEEQDREQRAKLDDCLDRIAKLTNAVLDM